MILDCTLRDGGYYNNWDFDSEVIKKYLAAMASANIDYVELGLRNFPKNGFLGAFAYTTEDFLNSLTLPKGPIYGVMVDAKTILKSGLPVTDAIDALFVPSCDSKVDLVRVAAHFNEVELSGPIIERLKSLGYIVGLNLMQAGGKATEVIEEKAAHVSHWGVLDVLYFADSLGNMDEKEVKRIIDALRANWSGQMGIHTHDNMGKGLSNTISAIDLGVLWTDSTVTGMGRGAGNTKTEYLLATLASQGHNYKPKPVYELAVHYFENMQKEYGWGSSLLYFLGAQNNVHPTYVQNLISSTHYVSDEVIGAMDYLSKSKETASYNGEILDTAISFCNISGEITGTNDVEDFFDGMNLLIVTNAPSTAKYADAIELYIKKKKPVVISVNVNKYIKPCYVDYYVVSHNSKFLSDSLIYKDLDKPIILPKCRFTESELIELSDIHMIDFGLKVEPSVLEVENTYATIPYDITSAYILTALIKSKPKSVSVVGFDGYESADIRHQEMIEFLSLYKAKNLSFELTSLTPTTYPINKSSIYAPM
jgi:4-hydroxy 2-oxovalerate aldolase